ncbi:hypothetical protein QF035_010509 [Streptomyces umbrinus]|uniref:Uncharacterized protein n=1 Tax=Streptomyces umbrinus TaxID=67370 RepID=A0ABU0TAU5_9ACTN|nr:hypothetical protein [Streptomyces umbrinus]MDQ1032927.1 hypothetical protein [Streptomyces umbrinus]
MRFRTRAGKTFAGAPLGTCVVLAALLALLLSAPTASACDVSYQYKPTIDVADSGRGLGLVKQCSKGTSLAGTAILALLAASALAAGGVIAFRRGRVRAETLDGDPLSGYLGRTGGHDADTSL